MPKERQKHLKPVETRPGIMYCSCKVHTKSCFWLSDFQTILTALQTPRYKIAMQLMPMLEPLATNNTQSKIHLASSLKLLSKISVALQVA